MISSRPPPRDSWVPPPRGWRGLAHDERLRVLFAAALIGVCGALTAASFRWLVTSAWAVFTRVSSLGMPWLLLVVAAPAVGAVLAVTIVRRFAAEPEGHGVSAIRASLITSGGFIRGRTALAKAIACAATTTSGGSAGCEGPIARLAAGFGSWLAAGLRIDRTRLPTLTACGAAASIAALFDAPIAGVVFSVEIILGGYAVRSFAPLVVAAAAATATSRTIWGRARPFPSPAILVSHTRDLLLFALVGCCCGLLGVVFTQALEAAPKWMHRTRLHAWARAGITGLAVGAACLVAPGAFGVGYPVLHELLAGHLAIAVLAVLILVKFAATVMTLGSGGAGGVFSPALVMGASTGALLSGIARSLGLGMSNGTGAFAVVGAAAMMAATSHAPFTAVVLVYELTERYVVLLPAAIACVMATLVATLLRREPAYDAELRRRGISRSSPRAAAVVMRDRRVAPLVRSIRQTVPDTTPAQEVLSRRKYLRQSVLVVVDSITGTPLGILDLDRIEGVDPDAVDGPSVGDLMSRCPSARHDRTLTEAVAQFVRHKVAALPVVDDAGRACGLLWRHEVLDACARELATEFALPARDPMSASDTPLVHSDGVAAVLVPAKLVGKSVRSVDLRKLYGLVCLGIRRATDDGTFAPIPMAPTVVFSVNDLLIVSGPSDRIAQMHEPSPPETTSSGRGD